MPWGMCGAGLTGSYNVSHHHMQHQYIKCPWKCSLLLQQRSSTIEYVVIAQHLPSLVACILYNHQNQHRFDIDPCMAQMYMYKKFHIFNETSPLSLRTAKQ